MLSLELRTKPGAQLPKAAWPPCGHSLPGCPYLRSSFVTGVDSQIENEGGLS